MFKYAKELYNDYQEMVVKPEKEFYKKHMIGVVLVNAIPITLILAIPTICVSLVRMTTNKITTSEKEGSEL
jgi:hypothetical protein